MSEPAGIEPVGDGQKECHGKSRADARQNADGRAECHADQRVEQVHGLGCNLKTVQKEFECAHGQMFPCRARLPRNSRPTAVKPLIFVVL